MDPSHVARLWRAKLVVAQRPSLFDEGQFYVPWEDVSRITDPENVTEEELELLGMHGIQEYRDRIVYRERILCTLIYSYLTHMFLPLSDIEYLHHNSMNDEQLPVSYRIENRVITVTGVENFFSGWEQSEIYDFCDSQWKFAVPVLKWNRWKQLSSDFDPVHRPRTVFPFDSETPPKTTPFSRVWKVKIHTSHVDEDLMIRGHRRWENEFVALKESLNVDSPEVNAAVHEALNERGTHSELRSDRVDRNLWPFRFHLTELYWAFRRQNTHYMIFPWAEGGSLSDFWHGKDPRQFNSFKLKKWMKKNVIGLLGAVCALHNIQCSHGDLKPGNILVFSKPKHPKHPDERDYSYYYGWESSKTASVVLSPRELGILKITDLGTARANSDATVGRTRDANAFTGAQRYAPPEFDRHTLEHNSVRSRLYDIWSMGCILLEFITWACYGGDGVRRFSSRLEEPYPGRFWTYGENKRKTLHPYVRHQFRKLKRRLKGTGTDKESQESQEWLKWLNKELQGYLLWLLEVVRSQMLVVNLDKEIPAIPKQFEDSSTDEEGSSSEGTETIYRASAQTLHTQFFGPVKSSNKESVEEEDPSPPPTLSTEEFQAVPSTILKHTADE